MTDDDQATFTEDVDPIEEINDADIPLKVHLIDFACSSQYDVDCYDTGNRRCQ